MMGGELFCEIYCNEVIDDFVEKYESLSALRCSGLLHPSISMMVVTLYSFKAQSHWG